MNEQTGHPDQKICAECMSVIPAAARRCAHCGAKQPRPATGNGPKIILFAIVGFIAVSIFTAIVNPNTGTSTGTDVSTTPPAQQDLSAAAYVVSQNYVKAALKSPSTASFPFFADQVNKLNNSYRVTSYVDAENSFGAKIRSNWMTILRYNGGESADPNNWTLIEFVFDGKVVYSNSSSTTTTNTKQ